MHSGTIIWLLLPVLLLVLEITSIQFKGKSFPAELYYLLPTCCESEVHRIPSVESHLGSTRYWGSPIDLRNPAILWH
ncbi:hypothetical protein ES707_20203 [subsurface metagenome]